MIKNVKIAFYFLFYFSNMSGTRGSVFRGDDFEIYIAFECFHIGDHKYSNEAFIFLLRIINYGFFQLYSSAIRRQELQAGVFLGFLKCMFRIGSWSPTLGPHVTGWCLPWFSKMHV